MDKKVIRIGIFADTLNNVGTGSGSYLSFLVRNMIKVITELPEYRHIELTLIRRKIKNLPELNFDADVRMNWIILCFYVFSKIF